MNTFIALPSGLRINTVHIIGYRTSDSGKTRIVHSILGKDGRLLEFEEDMTAAELDGLLQPQTVIVSPVLELRLPRPGEAVCFKWEGKQRHGVVQSPQVEDDKIIIVSDGDEYQYDLPSSYTVKLQ